MAQTGLADVKEKEKNNRRHIRSRTNRVVLQVDNSSDGRKDKRLHSSRQHAQASEGFLLLAVGDAASLTQILFQLLKTEGTF